MSLLQPSPTDDRMVAVRRHVLAAAAFAAAAGVWVVAGGTLPGGRWLAVHLLTLGVATNLLAGLMPYFARTVLKVPADDEGARLRFALLNGGALLLLVGLPTGTLAAVAVGSTLLSVGVFALWRTLRTARRRALPSRFGFVARVYERACGAFLHGAILGAVMGLGLIPGGWYGGVRLAHLHVNLLGWVGLPLLATLLTLGPTVLRTRMADGAGPRAAKALSRAATALTVAVVALALSGAPGAWGRALEVVAAGGLAVYAWGVAAICLPILQVWRTRVPSLGATLLASACVWFPIAIAADVVLVGTGATVLLDVVAPALLLGVLVHAILGSLLHLLPMALPRTLEGRKELRARLSALPRWWVVPLNGGVLAVSAVLVAGRADAVLPSGTATAAWAALAASVLLLGARMAWSCLAVRHREAV
jgi:hypothetical protein